MHNYKINLNKIVDLSSDKFHELCLTNPAIKLERNEQGEVIIMSHTGGETGRKNAYLLMQIGNWNEQNKKGEIFDSSTCFTFPSGAIRSPDLAWIRNCRWNNLTKEEKEKFPLIVPDFVLELMSPHESFFEIQEKMIDYINEGVKLGWLINPKNQIVEIYRQGQNKKILNNPQTLFGEDILIGLMIDLEKIWT